MKGQQLPVDLIYKILLFLLIAFVILGIFIFSSKDIMERVKTGQIYKDIENIFKKWMGR